MLWLKLKPGETIDVRDKDNNRVGVLHAEQRGHGVRLGFDGLTALRFDRVPAPKLPGRNTAAAQRL